MKQLAIEINDLHFSYGKKQVLKGLNLEVPQGAIFGFLGRNGAGKTTTIKTLLGLQRPKAGTCTIDGLDSFADAIEVRARIGYMAEDQQMYGWMRVEQIIKWVAGFYKEWDYAFTDELLTVLRLDKKSKVKALSKGQNSSLALMLALGHRPGLVILDDPTLGLDPIARKDFLRQVIDLLQSQGVTVFFSSHLLYEIEPVADHIAILDEGVICKVGKTDELRESVRRFVIGGGADIDCRHLPGLLDVQRTGDQLAITVEACSQVTRDQIQRLSPNGLTETALNLDEIFEAYVVGNRGQLVSHSL
ncbi:MAG: ATP-binding cassette domain-containing protein [Planctomycetes bacterium]|nr:ATP-binding cassette domain-containing protein [Planctomycetota bacterium]